VFDAGTPSRMNGTSSSAAHSAFGNGINAAAAASGGPKFTPAMIEQLCAEHEEVRNRLLQCFKLALRFRGWRVTFARSDVPLYIINTIS
jgi:hypothetical protein